jgi:glutathione S-transferase
LFGTYVSPTWAGWLGLVFVVGRVVYLLTYVRDPAKREIGFAMGAVPVVILLLGALWGAGRALL